MSLNHNSFPDAQQELLPGVERRQYQIDCLDILKETREQGEKKALIHIATGLGKTIVIALDIDQFLIEQPDARILFLCHRAEILDQAREVLEKTLARHHKTFATFDVTNATPKTMAADVMFASYQSMNSGNTEDGKWREVFNEYDFDYIVADESHHATAPTYLPTIQYFKPQFLLGVTATPNRRDDRDIREYFGDEKYVMSLAQGIAEGWLSKLNYSVISHNAPVTAEGISEDIKNRTEHLGDPKTMIFTNTIEESKRFAAVLPNAVAMYSGMGSEERKSALQSFRDGTVRTIVSVNLLNEGIDISDVEVVVFARSTESEAIFLQQLGRGMRKAFNKKELLVLDYAANNHRLLMVESLIHTIGRVYKKPEDKDENVDGDLAEAMQSGGLIEFETASFRFDGEDINILELLEDRRRARILVEEWTVEKSIEKYKEVEALVGASPRRKDLIDHLGEFSVKIMLRAFSGHLSELHNIIYDERHPNLRNELIEVSDIAFELNKEEGYKVNITAGRIIKLIQEMSIPTQKIPNKTHGTMVHAVHRSRLVEIKQAANATRKKLKPDEPQRGQAWLERRRFNELELGKMPDDWMPVQDIIDGFELPYTYDQVLWAVQLANIQVHRFKAIGDIRGQGTLYSACIQIVRIDALIEKLLFLDKPA